MKVSKHLLFLLICIVSALGVTWLPDVSHAQIIASQALHDVNQKKLVYDLSISVSQTHIVEFTPIDVTYTMSVGIVGLGSADPAPTSVDVCPALIRPETTCAHVAVALPGRTYRGTIKAMAPWAGANSVLRVVALVPGPLLAEMRKPLVVRVGTVPLTVFARYDVAIEGFNVITTRSTSTDTDWITLQGLVTATPPDPSATADGCHFASITWCIFRSRYGDAGDGFHAVQNVRAGP